MSVKIGLKFALVLALLPMTGWGQVQLPSDRGTLGPSPFFLVEVPSEEDFAYHLYLRGIHHDSMLLFSGDGETKNALASRSTTNLGLGIRLNRFTTVFAQSELLLHQSGDGVSADSPLSRQSLLGSTQLALRFGSTSSLQEPTSFAIQTVLHTPSERGDPLFDAPTVNASLIGLVSHKVERMTLGSNLGVRYLPERTRGPLYQQSKLLGQVGVAYQINQTVEPSMEVAYTQGLLDSNERDLRLNTGGRIHVSSDVQVQLTAGFGFFGTPGTPAQTYTVNLNFIGSGQRSDKSGGSGDYPTPLQRRNLALPATTGEVPVFTMTSDRDGDSIIDIEDDCPFMQEDIDGVSDADGCPDVDNDADGIVDAQDSAPLEPEDFDGFEDADGRPDVDNDRDGITDTLDLCPNEFGWNDGCPQSRFGWRKELQKLINPPAAFTTSESIVYFAHHRLGADLLNGPSMNLKVLKQASDWLIAHPSWARFNVVVRFCETPDDPTAGQRALDYAKRVAFGLADLGVNQERFGFTSLPRFAPPSDKCKFELLFAKLTPTDGFGERIAEQARKPSKKERLLPIQFLPSDARLASSSLKILVELARALKKATGTFEIQVHADALGDPKKRQRLTEDRAKQIEIALAKLGVPDHRFRVRGFGGSTPVASNQSVTGRRQNNRVVLIRLRKENDE